MTVSYINSPPYQIVANIYVHRLLQLGPKRVGFFRKLNCKTQDALPLAAVRRATYESIGPFKDPGGSGSELYFFTIASWLKSRRT